MITDFPSSIYQQGALSLALLYKNNFVGNIYYGNSAIFEEIAAGMTFWAGIQNRDGSFNEWFPNERSFVATAFTTYAISEALLLLGDEIGRLQEQKKEILYCALKRAGKWLLKNRELFVSNHIAGGAAALYNLYVLTNEGEFRSGAREKIDQILSFQDEEGWFREYQGVDLGYLSVSVDYLAKYYKKTKDAELLRAIEKALSFLKYFIHTDGSCGGEYGSRDTKYLIPHGLRILAATSESASYILNKIQEGMSKYTLPSLTTPDDRYFVFFFLPNLLQYEFEDIKNVSAPILEDRFFRFFKNSGLISFKNNDYHFVCNVKKSGLFKIFSTRDPKLEYSDSGYFAKFGNGKLATSGYLHDHKFSVNLDINGFGNFETSSPFIYIGSYTKYSKFLFILRIFNFTLGRFGRIAELFSGFLKKSFILRRYFAPLVLTRTLAVDKTGIVIRDVIKVSRRIRLVSLLREESAHTQFSPTSSYFILSDLGVSTQGEDFSDRLNDQGEIEITTQFIWIDTKLKIEKKIR